MCHKTRNIVRLNNKIVIIPSGDGMKMKYVINNHYDLKTSSTTDIINDEYIGVFDSLTIFYLL